MLAAVAILEQAVQLLAEGFVLAQGLFDLGGFEVAQGVVKVGGESFAEDEGHG